MSMPCLKPLAKQCTFANFRISTSQISRIQLIIKTLRLMQTICSHLRDNNQCTETVQVTLPGKTLASFP